MLTSQHLCDIIESGDDNALYVAYYAEKEFKMEQERFIRFVHLIDGIHKSIQKIRVESAAELGIKGVHVFWLHELLIHPEGLSATELAASNHVDRSLISREISMLEANGLIKSERPSGKRNYNSKLTLTKSGVEMAKRIKEIAMQFQSLGGRDIDSEELSLFYTTLEKLYNNFEQLC